MLVKTSELVGAALDYAVARVIALGTDQLRIIHREVFIKNCDDLILCRFSTDWAQGGPIIEREGINVMLRYGSLPPNHVQDVWDAVIEPEFYTSGRPNSGVKRQVIASGPTPLIAAMRCFVASKLGEGVKIPEELA